MSVVFLRGETGLLQAIEGAGQQYRLTPPESTADRGKDQVIDALRRRLDELKQTVATKDMELRGKQWEIDILYGKLAANSELSDAELSQQLQRALARLALVES